jgi:hypothetical protein
VGCGSTRDELRVEPALSVESLAAVPYPAGPYGLLAGDVFPNLVLDGYRGARAPWGKLAMAMYYDPDGRRGINALVIDVSAPWCWSSRDFAKMIPRFQADTIDRGARFLTVLVQDARRDPPTQATVDEWLDNYSLTSDIAIDRAEQTTPVGSAVPRIYIINPRTMRIVRVNEGFAPDSATLPGLNVVLAANG